MKERNLWRGHDGDLNDGGLIDGGLNKTATITRKHPESDASKHHNPTTTGASENESMLTSPYFEAS